MGSNRSDPASTNRLPQEGEILAGKFLIERTLGIGGMGGVFAATHLELGHRVALKVMLPHLTSNVEFAGRFLREAKAAASLKSEHVARVSDVGHFADGSPYMVMELLDGTDLDDLVRKRGSLPIPEAVGYVLQACDAIAEAHALGIIHRDLKPSNLFVEMRPGMLPSLKVLDFGISKSTKLDPGPTGAQTLTATDSTLGSPHYMSPEQLRSAKRVDARTDIWSLGIILQKLLTGHLAFESDSIGAHLAMIVADPPTLLRQRMPGAPPELEVAILRCLQKDLARRYQNVGQLVLALAPFAPPEAQPMIERVMSLVGREAATAPLPPLDEQAGGMRQTFDSQLPIITGLGGVTQSGDAPTIAGWVPGDRHKPSRSGLRVAIGAGVLVVAVAIGVGAQRLFGPGATPAANATASATAAPPPPPPSAAPSATAVNAPPLPTEVSIRIEVEPRDAVVEIDGNPTRDNPIHLPRGEDTHRLVVRAFGYATEVRDVSAKADAALAIVLHRSAAGGKPGKAAGPGDAPPPQKKLKGPMETQL